MTPISFEHHRPCETSPAAFRSALDALLQKLTSDGNTVAMFELPLPPFSNSFGETQRHLARRYGIRLIPKTCLAKVFATDGATIDGIHLTQSGHLALAKAVEEMLLIDNSPTPYQR